MKQMSVLMWTILFLFLIGTGGALAEEPPGVLEGVGTYFEITDSGYLNVTVSSTETINLRLESIPEMVMMRIESGSSSPSTSITLGGFLPQTTYYKYEDDYHNLEVFTTDTNGNYTYTQDISTPHLVFIQIGPSTKFIKNDPTGGDCTSIGNWDASSMTCTLTTNVSESIQIDSDGITLDGGNKILSGSPGINCVYLFGRTGVTIKNLTIENCSNGILLNQSSNNTIENNTISNSVSRGTYLITYSHSNILTGNTISGTGVSSWAWGIYSYLANDNIINNNTIDSNRTAIHMNSCNNNTITNNAVTSNWSYGIVVVTCVSNKIYNNNLIDNSTQAYVYAGGGNLFYLDPPTGGNYWSNYDTPGEGCNDTNGDGFCDTAYTFTGGQDNYPWTTQNGWALNNYTNFLPPINEVLPYSAFKSGRCVPAKFQVTDMNGNCVSTVVANFKYQRCGDGTYGEEYEGESRSNATTGSLFRYDPDACQYIFNWDTTGIEPGTYNIYAKDPNNVPLVTGQVVIRP